jgi:hypothetical protein
LSIDGIEKLAAEAASQRIFADLVARCRPHPTSDNPVKKIPFSELDSEEIKEPFRFLLLQGV